MFSYFYKIEINAFTQDGISMYKGKQQKAFTDATGAVALEDPNIFQTYIVCSEYGKDAAGGTEWKTRLTYGKVAAGSLMGVLFSIIYSRCYIHTRHCSEHLHGV